MRDYRRIYLVYPQLGTEVAIYVQRNRLELPDAKALPIRQSLTAELKEWSTPADRLFNRLNYTCLSYLTSIEDPLKRAFYEQEAIRGCWTVRELARQVSSLYFERMELSKDKLAMQKLTVKDSQQLSPRDILHNPVTLEYLGSPTVRQ